MAQIYVNSGLVKPKSIHIWNSSAQLWEENRIGYVRVNGEWIPFIEYIRWIYEEGVEHIPLILTSGAGHYVTRNSDSLELSPSFDGIGVLSTSISVDVSEYNSLSVEWKYVSSRTNNATLTISRTRGNTSSVLASTDVRVPSGVVINSIDISDITGDVFFNFQLRGYEVWPVLTLYKLWLE